MDIRNRMFIMARHARTSTLWDRTRFWLDLLLLVAMDFAWTVRRPWSPYHAAHGAGLLWGGFLCLWSPPRLDEPLAHRTFVLSESTVS
jgi:hypothetical protein